MLGLSFLAVVDARADGKIPILRRLLDSVDERQTEMVANFAQDYIGEICEGNRPQINSRGLEAVQKRAQRIANKCYDKPSVEKSLGSFEGDNQAWAEAIFFDSIIQNKMDHLTCHEAALNCIDKDQSKAQIANDFVNRVKAYQIYKERYKSYEAASDEERANIKFTPEEQKFLLPFLLQTTTSDGTVKTAEEFFKEYPPVIALGLLVSDQNLESNQGFIFHETFTSLVKDNDALEQFSSLNRNQQTQLILEHLNNEKTNQLESIRKAKAELQQACRPVDGDTSQCFYRPMFEQKRKLLDEYIMQTAYDPTQWGQQNQTKSPLKGISEQEKDFACQLQLKYGPGALRFDNEMYKIQVLFALTPFGRTVLGALSQREMTVALVTGQLSKKIPMGFVASASSTSLSWSARVALVAQMDNLYRQCTATAVKAQQKLNTKTTKKPMISREEYLERCRSCQKRPTSQKRINYSCFKEVTRWLIGRRLDSSTIASGAQMTDKALNDGNSKPTIAQQIDKASEVISLFLANWTLMNDLDFTVGSAFDDELEKK